MAYTIVGKIINIGAPITLSSRSGVSFTKRELVIAVQKFDPNTGNPYSDRENTPVLTFIGDKGRDLDHFQVGQVVSVSFELTGRTYVDTTGATRYINDVRGYRVEQYVGYGIQPKQPATTDLSQPTNPLQPCAAPQIPQPGPQPAVATLLEQSGDGLPF